MQERGERTSIDSSLRSGGGGAVRLRVRLLGAAEVILDGRRLREFNSPRLQRFLAMIALRREPHERSRLAFVLWPESSERQAHTNLRKLIHEFRRALPGVEDFIEIEKKTVRWLPTAPSEVDVLSFRDAIASGDFEQASRLYHGDLLPSCYDDWVLQEREELRAEALGVHRRLAKAAAERDDHRAAIRHAEAVNDLDAADEAAIRILMQAHLALGDRAAALRAYQRYADTLRRELAIEPGEDLVALCDVFRGDPSDRDRPRVSDQDVPPFVGRDQEWRAVLEAWRTSRAGRAHLALLTGVPGIGKSRLAQELGRQAQSGGHEVATARAYEAAGRLPWGPVVDLLRSAGIQQRIRAVGQVWTAELTRLLPELGSAIGQPPNGVARRHRLFDAVCQAIAVHDKAQVLIIDDLQWCDTETIELIGYLLRAYPQTPVLIVGTVRWEELPDRHPLPGLVDALERDQAVTVITIDALDQASTAALAAELQSVEEIDPGLADRLWSETEGNPLFVVETIQAGISSAGAQGVLTPTMRSVLRARLGQLTNGAQNLAEVAAIFGRSFSAHAIVTAMGVGEQAIADQLDELWRRRIVIERGQGYDFSHDKLREVALEMINPARRRRLHRVVANALVREHREDPTAVSAQLAAHYDQAGMVEQAIAAYRTAGARAVAMSGLDEAVAMYRRALALLAELQASPDRDAIELDIRIALGSPLVAIKGYGAESSHRLYERAQSICRKLGVPIAPPILRGLGLARLQGCRFDASSDFAKALIDHESGDQVAGTEGRYLMGVSAFWQGDLGKSHRFLEAAIEHYDTARREEHLALYAQDPRAVCLVRLGLSTLWSGDPARAEAMARSARELADELDHLMTSAYVITYGAILAAVAGDFIRLEDILTHADRVWSRLSERYLRVVLDALRAWLDVRAGSDAGIGKILQSVERSRIEGENLHLSFTLLLLAMARGLRDELHEGRAATRDALAWSERCNQRYLVAELLRVDGELAYGLGETDHALSSLRQAVDVSRTQGAQWLRLKALHSLALRFPDPEVQAELAALADQLPSGQDLPAFRAATAFLRGTG
ncbi:transcriptional regulator [Oricola cellulosilytica]|uniref:Transcriptional regulator n=2 Tax=Oricola cellulosilytica TaxID=1429082 RepID=A0A4R0PBG3_9HYPH|nr:transcriptional regulator [Oricola cellulosilytica]